MNDPLNRVIGLILDDLPDSVSGRRSRLEPLIAALPFGSEERAKVALILQHLNQADVLQREFPGLLGGGAGMAEAQGGRDKQEPIIR